MKIERRQLVLAAWFAIPAVLGTGCDVGTKVWAEESLGDLPNQTMQVFDPWLDFTLHYNPGTAFSFIRDLGASRAIFGAIALILPIGLFFVAMRRHRWEAISLGLVAAGAIGNGWERLFQGQVVDFIRVNYPWGGSWPVFNVADAWVAIGVAMLLIAGWIVRRGKDQPPADSPAAT